MIQPDRFLGRPLVPLLKNSRPVLKNVLKPLVNHVLIPLGLTASAVDVEIYQKILGLELSPREQEHEQ